MRAGAAPEVAPHIAAVGVAVERPERVGLEPRHHIVANPLARRGAQRGGGGEGQQFIEKGPVVGARVARFIVTGSQRDSLF